MENIKMITPDDKRFLADIAETMDSVILCEGLPDLPPNSVQLDSNNMGVRIARSRFRHEPSLCAFLNDLEHPNANTPRHVFEGLTRKPVTLAFTEEGNGAIFIASFPMISDQFGLLTIPAPQFVCYALTDGFFLRSAPQDGTAITWGVPMAKLSGIRSANPNLMQELVRRYAGRTLKQEQPQAGTILNLQDNGMILSNVPIDAFKAPVAAIAKQHGITLPMSFFIT